VSKYVRVYYSIVDDDRFADVFDTPHLATWLRLLLIADAIWPATAYIPAKERKASVSFLADKGLLELCGDGRFRVHGLDAERERRSNAAAIGGRARQRPQSKRSAVAEQTVSLDEQSKARAEQSAPLNGNDDGRADLEAYLVVTAGRIPSVRQRALMDAYCQAFDATGPARAARLIYGHPQDPIGALKTDLEAFRNLRRDEALASEEPKPAPRRKGSGLTGINAELADMFRKLDAGEAVS
jgi:hypothetical protein